MICCRHPQTPSTRPSPGVVQAIIRTTFNAAAEHFDDAPLFFWDRCGTRTVELAGVAPGDRVLDVCCGSGASALPAAERAGPTGRVVGVDLAERLLVRARAKARERRLDNVRFVEGDMTNLEVADGSMDVVICALGLYYAQDQPSALAELWRTVRPGGTLAVTTWGRQALEPAQTMFLDALAAERPDLGRRQALPWDRLDQPAALTNVFLKGGAPPPTIVQETLVHPMGADDFWTVVLGSGYRISVDTMGPVAADRVRTALRQRMNQAQVQDLTSDFIYARVRKDRTDRQSSKGEDLMSGGTSPSTPGGPHTSVSNLPETAEVVAVEEPITQPPSIGGGPAGPKVADAKERVKGHTTRKESAPAEIWVAPETSLPDIGEASFGAPLPLPETVHGPDDRVQITDTASYPWRVHASLQITAADNSQWIGTGWFIGPHTLITAGHVVYITNSGVPGRDGWVKSINVMPGRNGTTLPFGSVTSTNFRSVTGWTEDGDENFDYGAIITPTELGDTVGFFGFGVWPDADLVAATANISGYPSDQAVGTQWYDSNSIASVNSQKVFYDIDTVGGQSGSAVYRIIDGDRYGVAVHAYGGATTNSGTRIVQAVYDNMVAWKA